MTYKKAGVDIDKADSLVRYLKKKAPAIGGFSGLFPLKLEGMRRPHLVASTDGVGTKLRVAMALKKHDTIGIDLVAMCVNDLVTCGAKPLIFLDYYAMGKLQVEQSKQIMEGILEGCRQARTMLIGGETAEMPGSYPKGEYDLAGFAVGVVDKHDVIDGSKIYPGDLILGLPSSGLHSNGFSLARRVFKGALLRKWGKKLLTPTRIYVSEIDRLLKGFRREEQIVLGMAHITGGGLPDNVRRILPRRCKAIIHAGAWRIPPVFEEIRRRGRVPRKDMWRTFNMGIGMVIVIRPEALELARRILPEAKLIGEIISGRPEVVLNGRKDA
ncbi:MAG: phosphoribosylformylglycinamidine cyclo-ligase [Elusimicrobiota bacterium]